MAKDALTKGHPPTALKGSGASLYSVDLSRSACINTGDTPVGYRVKDGLMNSTLPVQIGCTALRYRTLTGTGTLLYTLDKYRYLELGRTGHSVAVMPAC